MFPRPGWLTWPFYFISDRDSPVCLEITPCKMFRNIIIEDNGWKLSGYLIGSLLREEIRI